MVRTNHGKSITNVSHKNPTATNETAMVDQRWLMIQTAAYLRAEKRGFQGGDCVRDWLDAEREIDVLLKGDNRDGHVGTN